MTALLYFALKDNLVVDPRILLHPELDSIQAQIGFTDPFDMNWILLSQSDEMYRFRYHFGVYLSRAVLQSNVMDLQSRLQTEWLALLGELPKITYRHTLVI